MNVQACSAGRSGAGSFSSFFGLGAALTHVAIKIAATLQDIVERRAERTFYNSVSPCIKPFSSLILAPSTRN